MPDNQKFTLAKYRLERARQTYLTSLDNLNNGKYMDANNRAYFSVYNSIRAVLALDGVDFKKHSGVISYFREKYIKPKIFDSIYSNIIGKASIIRNKSDYEDFYIATHEEAEEQVNNALLFYDAIAEYVNKFIN